MVGKLEGKVMFGALYCIVLYYIVFSRIIFDELVPYTNFLVYKLLYNHIILKCHIMFYCTRLPPNIVLY